MDIVENYGGKYYKPGLVLRQLVKNGVVAGANGDVLGASNPAHITSDNPTVINNTKADIFLDRENGQKYKQLKDDLENDFSKGIDNYPPTVECAF